MTRGETGPHSYENYSALSSPMNCGYNRQLPIVQAFNPWIAQYIFSYQIDDFIASAEKISADFVDTWKFQEKFKALNIANSINQEIKDEIADKLISKKAFFTKPEVCRSILGFSIDLIQQVSRTEEKHYAFIRNLAANAMLKSEQLSEYIRHLEAIPGNSAIIALAINDQKMLVNTYDFLNKSLPVKGRYDFVSMASTAENITLTNVHPVIGEFIVKKVGEVYQNIKDINLPFRLVEVLKKLKAL